MNSSSDAKNPRTTQDQSRAASRNERAGYGLHARASRPDLRMNRPDVRRPAPPDLRTSMPSLTDEDIRRAEWEGMTPNKPVAPHDDDDDGLPPSSSSGYGVEGEGSYTAARRYNEGLLRTVRSGQVDDLAQQAADALDGPEGSLLRQAERVAKRGPSL